MLRVIERAARGGAETVRRLQTFTRVDHDSAVGEVQLHLIARDAIDLTRPRWRDLAQKQGRPIEVRRELLPVPSLIGRAGALRDVVTNLLINAIDAMPQGGTIVVRTFQLPELGDAPPPPDAPVEVVVQVSDSGTGITPEVRERIFERYFTTKGRAGTGQGLSEVQEKVAEHGGSVEVQSDPGAGSTFTVRLPVRTASQAAEADAVDLDAPMTPAGILVVEDEELVRLPLVRLLSRWGHRVAEATCGADAFDLFVPGRYDMLITDLGLPDMPGREIVRRASALDSALKTVMLTGWGDDDSGEPPAADFILRKPFDQSELRAVLARALR
jgi:CheY-like chemotaxis protein